MRLAEFFYLYIQSTLGENAEYYQDKKVILCCGQAFL